MTAAPEAAQAAADRLGCSLEFVRLHWGEHVCLDGRPYASACLVVDPQKAGALEAVLVDFTPRVSTA